ncbi:MAG: TolC family protein [Termitinemataceae bacterium]|nr:MAG: TolC family protein [Termitinemataceae bacterium]
MGIYKKIGFVCLFLLVALVVFAQDADTSAASTPDVRKINVNEAVRLALQNNLSLQSSHVALDKKKRPADLAWNQFLPNVSLQGSLAAANKATKTISFDPTNGRPVEIEGPVWSMNGALSIQWQGLNVAMAEGIKQLKLNYESGLITYEKAKIQLERDVRKLYRSMLLADENLRVREQSFQLAEEQVRTSQANYSAGLSPELTLMQARLNRDKLIPEIDQTRNNRKVTMANFAMLLGLPYDTMFELVSHGAEDYNIPGDTADLIRNAAGNKVDLQELRSSIKTMRAARNAIRYQLWTPSLNMGWSLAPTFTGGDPFKDEWKSDSWTDRGNFSLQLVWSLNGLLPFTTQSANLRDMEDDLRAADINLALAIRSTEVEVYNQVFLIQQAKESIEAQQKTVALAQKTYNDTLTAFRAGLQDFIQVQNVEQQLREARLGVLQQQYNLFSLVTDLEYSLNVPFGSLSGKE